jgi:hypothetical protein
MFVRISTHCWIKIAENVDSFLGIEKLESMGDLWFKIRREHCGIGDNSKIDQI